MSAFQAGDRSDGLAGIGVDNFNAGAVGDVEAMGAGVGEEIIPAAFAADGPFVLNGVRRLGEGGQGRKREKRGGERGCQQAGGNELRRHVRKFLIWSGVGKSGVGKVEFLLVALAIGANCFQLRLQCRRQTLRMTEDRLMFPEELGNRSVEGRLPAGFSSLVDALERALHVANDKPAQGLGNPVGRSPVDERQVFEADGMAGNHASEQLACEVRCGNALPGVTAGEGEFAARVEATEGVQSIGIPAGPPQLWVNLTPSSTGNHSRTMRWMRA